MTQGVKGSPYEPTALTDEVFDALVESCRLGQTIESACTIAGIGESTFQRWKKAVNDGEAHVSVLDLWAAMKQATRQGIQERLAKIQRHGDSDWKALAWMLERQFPDEFSRRTNVNVGAGEDASAFAAAIRESIRGMDFRTRKAGRLSVTEAATNGSSNGSSNGA